MMNTIVNGGEHCWLCLSGNLPKTTVVDYTPQFNMLNATLDDKTSTGVINKGTMNR